MNAAETRFIQGQAQLLMHSRRVENAAASASARAGAPRPRGNYEQKAKAKAQPPVADTTARDIKLLAREHLLDHAVHAGVIQQGMRGHYATAFDADEQGCRAFLKSLGLHDVPKPQAASAEQAKPARVVSLD
jgi:hypothetical protein